MHVLRRLGRPLIRQSHAPYLYKNSTHTIQQLIPFRSLPIRMAVTTTKRKEPPSKAASKAKKPRPAVPEYHLTPSVHDVSGDIVWPAPKDQLENCKAFIRECAGAKKKVLIVPDKDADGLTSGLILYRTLELLGIPSELISVHLLDKGSNVHDDAEREAMAAKDPAYIFILDHGSRKAPPLIDTPHRAIVIDHHWATEEDFPEGADFVTACNSPPVATTSLLIYTICCDLHLDVREKCGWLCAIGTHGDLGTTLKWEPPFPDMKETFKKYTKKAINEATSSVNAPRRTATRDVITAWNALLDAPDPATLTKDKRLIAAREEIADEVERCTHTAPKFSYDSKIAVFRISSKAQVHPIIATRWAGHLQSSKLEIVLVANEGYLPDQVNFSCRIARCARGRDPPVNIIESLRAAAESSSSGTLLERLGESFARGHKEASGGIVGKDVFEELMACLRVGEKPEKSDATPKKQTKKQEVSPQKNNLMNYFGKPKG